MKGGKKPPPTGASLRRQAETRLRAGSLATAPTAATPGDAQRLLHELQVHQVELELQNEELQRARVELEASLEKYFDLFDFAPVGYFTLDDRGAIVEANLAGAALLEIDRARLIGRRLAEFVPEESRESLAGLLERLAADELRPRAELALRQGPAGARHLLLEGAVAAALPGRESRYRVAATDISERVAAERERVHLRFRLEKAERMESVGRLAGGVAHDFNNMLGVILGFTEIASDRLEPEHPIHRDLDEIRTAAQRAAALTNKLLAFASRQPVQPRRLDLGESISNLLPLVRRLVGTAIDVDWSPASGLWPVRLDPGQFDQVLTDLTVNARDAIAGKGRLELRADNVTVERNRGAGGPVAGEYVRLTVTDSGAGMDAATLRHLFEPFFSKLPFGQGAGLGLATVYGVVRQNGGYVEVASEPERGTTFQLYWPRLLDDADPPMPKRGEAVADEAQKTVLLVDDEPALLRLVGTMVERLGHRSLAAGSPREALRLAARRTRRIDLLVTDVVMPEMNGRELADRLTALHPDLKLLFISGYSAEAIADHGILAEGVQFLRKPFTAEAFAAKVGAALRTTS